MIKLLAATATMLAPAAEASCRMALVFAQDVSQSVDAAEYRLQAEGVADALTDPEIVDLILFMDGTVALAAFEWSGRTQRNMIRDWTVVDSAPALEGFANALRQHQRGFQFGPTAIGTALETAHELLTTAPPCDRNVVDVSGDGLLNDGPSVMSVYAALDFSEITVNALVVGGDTSPEITEFYRTEVVRGPGSFLEIAEDFQDYQRAMTRKLRRELALPLSEVR